jgi:CheY-like chemotaxis protein
MTTSHPGDDIEADVVHELRSALHTIAGHAALLDDQTRDERRRRSTSSIISAARRATAILDAARLLDLRVPDASAAVDLRVAIDRAVATHRPMLASRHVTVEPTSEPGDRVAHDNDPVLTRCDADTVDVVLDLVLCWATLRAEPGTALWFDAANDVTDGRSTVVVRLDGSIDTERDATLRIVRRLVQPVGGEIACGHDRRSLRVLLPAAHGAPVREHIGRTALRHRPPGAATPPTSSRILVVDDDEHSRAFVELALGSAGCAVLSARDLEEARRVLAEHDVDVVVADQHLGGGRGVDLLRHMSGRDQGCRCYLMTGDLDPLLLAEVRALGGQVLHKPVDLDLLLAVASDAAAGHVDEPLT